VRVNTARVERQTHHLAATMACPAAPWAASRALALALLAHSASAPSMGLGRRSALVDVKSAGQSLDIAQGGSAGGVSASAYFATLDLGVGAAPYRRTVSVQLDTGSSTLAIPADYGVSPSAAGVSCHSEQCSSGTACGPTCDSGGVDALAIGQCREREFCIDPDRSMCQDCCTADGLCFFSMRYGDGSGIAGGLHTDWISVGDGTLGAQYVFGGITAKAGNFEPEQVDGILGIGYAALNCNPTCHPSFIDSLVGSNDLPDLFALCLGGLDGRSSTWEIGEVVESKYSGTLRWLPVLEASYYVVPRPNSLYVGGMEVTGCSPEWLTDATGVDCGDDAWGEVIVDSGSTEILLNEPLYVATIGLLTALSPLAEGQTCIEFPDDYDPTASFPTLQFHFTDVAGLPFELEITASQYMLKNRDEDTPIGRTWFCLGIASGRRRTILGDVLMQAYYSVFDRRPTATAPYGSVGLAPVTECHASQPPLWKAMPSGVIGQGGLLEFLAANSGPEASGQPPGAPAVAQPAGGAMTQTDLEPGGQSCVDIAGVHYCDAEDIIAGMQAHPERVRQHDAVFPSLEQSHPAACNGTEPALLLATMGQPSQLNFFSDLHYGDNAHCAWELKCAAPGVPISARVTQLDIEAQFDMLSLSGAALPSGPTSIGNASQSGIMAAVRSSSETEAVVDLSGHSFDRDARAHEALVFSSASSDAGLSVAFHSDGFRTGRGFVLEYACGTFDRCGVPGGDGSSCNVVVDGGWQQTDVVPFAAPRPLFFTAMPGVEYLITARVLNGVAALNASVVLYEWSTAQIEKAGSRLAVADEGCDGDPQLLWRADLEPGASGDAETPQLVLVELEAGFVASSGQLAYRVDTHQPDAGCTAESACTGCFATAPGEAPQDDPTSLPSPSPPSPLLLIAAVAAVAACCAVVVVTTVKCGQRDNKDKRKAQQSDDDAEPGENTTLLKMEEGKLAAKSDSDEEDELKKKQQQKQQTAVATKTTSGGGATSPSSALPPILPGAGPGKPPVAPLPLDLAPSSRYDTYDTYIDRSGPPERTPPRGHPEYEKSKRDDRHASKPIALSSSRTGTSSGSGGGRGMLRRVDASPPATIPSTPSPPNFPARRASPAELVLGPVAEHPEHVQIARTHSLERDDEVEPQDGRPAEGLQPPPSAHDRAS
jgi:hypothetical protein